MKKGFLLPATTTSTTPSNARPAESTTSTRSERKVPAPEPIKGATTSTVKADAKTAANAPPVVGPTASVSTAATATATATTTTTEHAPTIPAFLRDLPRKYTPIDNYTPPPGATPSSGYGEKTTGGTKSKSNDCQSSDGRNCTCWLCGGSSASLELVELPTHIACFPELTNSLTSALQTKRDATLSEKCSVLLRFLRDAGPMEASQILHFLKNKDTFIFFTPPVPTKTIMPELFKQDLVDVMISILGKADSQPPIANMILELMLMEPEKVVRSCPVSRLVYPCFLAAVGDKKILCATLLGRFGILLSSLLEFEPLAAKDPEVVTKIDKTVSIVLRLFNREPLPVSVIQDILCMISNIANLCPLFESDTRLKMVQHARLLYLNPEMNLMVKLDAAVILANCFTCLQPQHLAKLSAEESALLDPNFAQSLALFSIRELVRDNITSYKFLRTLETLETVPGVVEFLTRYWAEKPSRMAKFLAKGNPLTLHGVLDLALKPAKNNAELMRIWNQFEEKRSRSQSRGVSQKRKLKGMKRNKLHHEYMTSVVQAAIGSKEELTEEQAESLAIAQAEAHVERPLPHCTVCNKPTTKQCSVCGKVRYCSKECQKKDWPAHKLVCRRPESKT
ncbi:hypothetical protein Pelo_13110 [Pelomyxa schiedti]|nr:hypothetical protein Pelo_13110 [Pelomyxa schiedti]